MHFIVQKDGAIPRKNSNVPASEYPVIVILKDNWNDYSYMTMCSLSVYLTHDSPAVSLGNCKIMYKGQDKWAWTLATHPPEFKRLPLNFCSIGIEVGFYKSVKSVLGRESGRLLLESLRDAGWNPRIWRQFENDDCFRFSLLREKSETAKIRDKVSQLFGKKDSSKKLSFKYNVLLPGAEKEIDLTVDFRRKSFLPYRVSLLVGRNGVGKTQILSNLAIALTGVLSDRRDNSQNSLDRLISAGRVSPMPSIYRVIAVSFNAFDSFEIVPDIDDADIKYSYCGIRKIDNSLMAADEQIGKIKHALAGMGIRELKLLSSAIKKTLGVKIEETGLDEAFYGKLSAGQRIALNILTHIVARIEDYSILLIDEPENHLHPQLATSLMSSIGDLLVKFKSFAIVATHSPLIAQQIPSASIKIIARREKDIDIFQPDIECFGENLSEISSALFETKEHERDYKAVLDKKIKSCKEDQERIREILDTRLGGNAMAYLVGATWGARSEER